MADRAAPSRDERSVWRFHQPHFDDADDPMWIEERRERHLLALNDAACEFFGVARADALDRTVDEIADVPVPRPEVGSAARWALRVEGRSRILDVRFHPFEFALRPAVLVVGRDLSPLLASVDADVWIRSVGSSARTVLSELMAVRRALRDGVHAEPGLDRAIERAADLVLSLGGGPDDPSV